MYIQTPDGKLANMDRFHEVAVVKLYTDFAVIAEGQPTSNEDHAASSILYRSTNLEDCNMYLQNLAELLGAVDTAGYERYIETDTTNIPAKLTNSLSSNDDGIAF